MDWQAWVDEGLARRTVGGLDLAMHHIHDAWTRCIASREACNRNEWRRVDFELREGFLFATEALFKRANLEPTRTYDFRLIQRAGREFFEPKMVDGIFERAAVLREMMPLEEEVSPEQARAIRQSIAASSEYIALVECYLFT